MDARRLLLSLLLPKKNSCGGQLALLTAPTAFTDIQTPDNCKSSCERGDSSSLLSGTCATKFMKTNSQQFGLEKDTKKDK